MENAMRLFVLMTILPFALQEEVVEGTCSCAIFPVSETEPIIEHTLPYNISCDQDSGKKCQELCVTLAESVQQRVPTLICEKLNIHVENLMVAVYMKSCSMSLWAYTGLKSTQPICCHEGETTVCHEIIQSMIEN